MKKIMFITGNKGKVQECIKLLSSFDITVEHHPLKYPEIQTDSLEEVVSSGIEYLKKRVTKPFIIEDAGLFIHKMNGFPGVYSKYVFYTIGLDGILRLLKDSSNRDAQFRSIYGFYHPEQSPKFFIGATNGRISEKAKGSHGFGYDPIFIPDGSKRTFAEMPTDEKNQFSHRGKALVKLGGFIKKINSY